MFDWTTFFTVLASLGTATVLGGLLGLERELRGRWAGLRTHIMVAMGAASFVLIWQFVSSSDWVGMEKIIEGIATGVGFIGAGTILKLTDRLEVKGLTTATSIWLSAAVGTAAGVRHYSLAIVATIISLLVLSVLGYMEYVFDQNSTAQTNNKPKESSHEATEQAGARDRGRTEKDDERPAARG